MLLLPTPEIYPLLSPFLKLLPLRNKPDQVIEGFLILKSYAEYLMAPLLDYRLSSNEIFC